MTMRPMKLVACTEPYWDFVRQLRTDSRVAAGFVQQATISPQQQIAYMTSHWHEYFICLYDDAPAGYVGCVDNDIRVCTHPDYQGTGAGSFMIREIARRFPHGIAKVKIANEPSHRLFVSCGFEPAYIVYKPPPS